MDIADTAATALIRLYLVLRISGYPDEIRREYLSNMSRVLPIQHHTRLGAHLWPLGVVTARRVYPKVSGLAAWSENCKWYSCH